MADKLKKETKQEISGDNYPELAALRKVLFENNPQPMWIYDLELIP